MISDAPAQPDVVVPEPASWSGVATDDRWTRFAHRGRTLELAGRTAALAVFVIVMSAGAIVAVRHRPWTGPAGQFGSAAAVAAAMAGYWTYRASGRWGLMLSAWRTERALLGRFPWCETPATLLGGGRRRISSCGVRVVLPDGPALLRFRWLPWSVQRIIIRSGRIWLCGPDHRGRAKVRVDGVIIMASARVVDTLPAGPATPNLATQTGSRPADEPQLADGRTHMRRVYRAARLPLAQVVLGLVICGSALSTRSVALVTLGAGVALDQMLVVYRVLRDEVWSRPAYRLLARADRWTPLPARIRWMGPWHGGPARGRVQLPDVGWVSMRMGFIAAANVATIQDTGTVWLAGDPAPGKPIAVGLPGYSYYAKARLGRRPSSDQR